ncbi:hypothetical protein HJFPF1_07044 [Paramyrothecium foliicola]|nr:hypothetical protein HJFPF1_07044 [Paramyrothecium foliicola]
MENTAYGDIITQTGNNSMNPNMDSVVRWAETSQIPIFIYGALSGPEGLLAHLPAAKRDERWAGQDDHDIILIRTHIHDSTSAEVGSASRPASHSLQYRYQAGSAREPRPRSIPSLSYASLQLSGHVARGAEHAGHLPPLGRLPRLGAFLAHRESDPKKEEANAAYLVPVVSGVPCSLHIEAAPLANAPKVSFLIPSSLPLPQATLPFRPCHQIKEKRESNGAAQRKPPPKRTDHTSPARTAAATAIILSPPGFEPEPVHDLNQDLDTSNRICTWIHRLLCLRDTAFKTLKSHEQKGLRHGGTFCVLQHVSQNLLARLATHPRSLVNRWHRHLVIATLGAADTLRHLNTTRNPASSKAQLP